MHTLSSAARMSPPATPIVRDADGFRDRFQADGHMVVPDVLDRTTCRHIERGLRRERGPKTWYKGRATSSALFHQAASHSRIIDVVTELLGPDIMLWGSIVVRRRAGQIHPWHTDIETAESHGKAVSVWIGLRNTNTKSSLQVISGSHRLGPSIQEVASRNGRPRGEADKLQVAHWAQELDPTCHLVSLGTTNGDAVFFDGRLWHGSDNTNLIGTRVALLLQYATPDFDVRIPDYSNLSHPFTFYSVPKPPCIMVTGRSGKVPNEYVPPPQRGGVTDPLITKWVGDLYPPTDDVSREWVPHSIFRGQTSAADQFSCHVSLLRPGHTPHEPHHHEDEEILIMLDGEAKLVAVDPDSGDVRETSVRRGHFAYYPSGHIHTITSVGPEPARYVMFKWKRDRKRTRADELPEFLGSAFDVEPGEDAFATSLLLQGPTTYLRKLHCHKTTLAPGAGYAPHVDAYDVAMVLLDGEIETLGTSVSGDSVIFCGAGEPHGMLNPGSKPAQYLVFEFHGHEYFGDAGWGGLARRAYRLMKSAARRTGVTRLIRRARRRG